MQYLSMIEMAKKTGIPTNTLLDYFYRYDIFFREYIIEGGIKKHPLSKIKIITAIHALTKNKNWIVEKNIVDVLMNQFPDQCPMADAQSGSQLINSTQKAGEPGNDVIAPAEALMPKTEDHLLDHFIKHSPIGIFQADLNGKLELANPELAWMLGYESTEQAIENIKNLNDDLFAEKEVSQDFFFQLFEAEEVHRYRAQIATQDGRTEEVLARARVIKNDKERYVGYYGFLINISDLKNAEDKLLKLNQQLQRISRVDGLTDIPNRRCFDEYLDREWKRMARNKQNLSIILCDIDFFKVYNDTYGHQAGDECLQKVAKAIESMARRPADLSARYGGEEFVVVLPETGIEDALTISENIRFKVATLKIPHENSKVRKYVSLSLGIASVVPDPTQVNGPEMLVGMADQALYRAKEGGRNRSASMQKR
ncbi:sensor domain-containing diguanylate cyclase [uncultured Desulfobacter sp.]|uniref:sensor domain-containing diguanylate cyclase n=1 Tax=uncultured Desulfobacter sp. TaxID=240139 RepID=UPI002AAB13F7|nr:sensor domain-containing diguanylate cyclase [uncultured Desulfobacter sp.]